MTKLAQASIIARKTIRYTIYGVIGLMLGKIVLDTSIGIYKRLFPKPPPAPTVKYGKLPKLPFPEQQMPTITYVLETPEGGFPKISDQAKVYFMPKLNPNLLSLDVAKAKAKNLGFTIEPEMISDTLYKFRHQTYPSTLEVNIITGVFSISYDLNADRSPLDRKPPIAEVATTAIKNYLNTGGVMPDDMTGPQKSDFLRLSDGKFVNALSLSEADVVKVNFFRKEYDKLPSLTLSPLQSNMWFIVSGAQNKNQQIIAGEYHYFPVDEEEFSTYPIKSPATAFEELKSGGGYIANQGLVKDGETLKIRRVYLAYFDPQESSEFFQPIYVFEGDKGFISYIPAVTPDFYGN